ncbi:hypothetical protein FRB93_005768 [Tulasnella sp. JGI-2019a]|nr:hypothetical protein FRB93_005768 [Tulasnella sp. JGI-2019a]
MFIRHQENPGVVPYIETVWTQKVPPQRVLLPNLFLMAAVFTSDLLLLWRVHIVWARSWRITAIPSFFLGVEMILQFLLIVRVARPPAATTLMMAFAGSTALVNTMCTALIAGRLWWVGGTPHRTQASNSLYKSIIAKLIESGALYTATVLVLVSFTAAQGYMGVGAFLTYVYTMIVAIAPMLLVLQLNETTASDSHVIDFDVTDRFRGTRSSRVRPPPVNTGIASATVSFVPMDSIGESESTPDTAKHSDKGDLNV